MKAGLPEDPTRQLEEQLAGVVAGQAREVLSEMAKAITADNAQRILGPMASLVATYNNAIGELRTEFDARPRKRRSLYNPVGVGEYLEAEEAGTLSGGETFGAQAIQQLVAVFKDLLPSITGLNKPRGEPVPIEPRVSTFEIANLTKALAEARGAGEPMAAIADKLEKRLDELLDEKGDEDVEDALPAELVGGFPTGGEGEEEEHLDGDGPDAGRSGEADELHSQGAQEGLA